MTKLIIFRGNSGSGKSTVAAKIAESSTSKIAIVDADHYREFMFFPKGECKDDVAALMTHNVKYALEHGYDVIFDSIFFAHERNKKYLASLLVDYHPAENFIFNFDVSLEETIARHKTRPQAKIFEGELLRDWYQPIESLGYDFEHTIPETNTLDQTIEFVAKTAGLRN